MDSPTRAALVFNELFRGLPVQEAVPQPKQKETKKSTQILSQ